MLSYYASEETKLKKRNQKYQSMCLRERRLAICLLICFLTNNEIRQMGF